MTEQAENLKRVTDRIGAAIISFARARLAMGAPASAYFYADELRRHVAKVCGSSAPASADRVLRSLRQAKRLDYAVISRSRSLYEIRSVAP